MIGIHRLRGESFDCPPGARRGKCSACGRPIAWISVGLRSNGAAHWLALDLDSAQWVERGLLKATPHDGRCSAVRRHGKGDPARVQVRRDSLSCLTEPRRVQPWKLRDGAYHPASNLAVVAAGGGRS